MTFLGLRWPSLFLAENASLAETRTRCHTAQNRSQTDSFSSCAEKAQDVSRRLSEIVPDARYH